MMELRYRTSCLGIIFEISVLLSTMIEHGLENPTSNSQCAIIKSNESSHQCFEKKDGVFFPITIS